MADYRNVGVLILAVGLLQISGGILGVITPIGLEAMGTPATLIGVIAALFAAGFMAGAVMAPSTIMRVGNIRVFSAGAAGAAATSLVMGLLPDMWAWAVLRPIQGLSIAWMFASAEAWMSSATPSTSRGGVLGFYHVIAKAALMAGPFLVVGYAALQPHAFIWTALFFALALVPVCMTRMQQPLSHQDVYLPWRDFLKLAPSAVAAAFLAGVINSGLLALLPLFAERLHLGETATGAAALAMAVAWIGGMVSQWPAGRISDHMDRRLVVAGMAGIALVAAIGLTLGAGRIPAWTVLFLLAVWGAGSLSFYGIAVAHGVDRARQDQISGLMAGLLFVWAAGSVIGPPLAGLAMATPLGPGGLFAFAGLFTVALILAMLVRLKVRASVEEEDRSNWELAQPTAVTGMEIDPRVEPLEPDQSGM
ncbi:MAG: MFS transporter [Hyphomonadaceae bacterium]|nr:MFS transporter [Hyphomonadaceae bacterium]